MSIDLPTPIAQYIAAENRGDAAAMAHCFAEDAVVRDEKQTMKGLARIEPLASVTKDDKIIVTNRLTGNFPGSPIELQFIFELDGDKIGSLEIRS